MPARDCWLRMVFDGRYKYIHTERFRPMLYDLQEDPQELTDLGTNPAYTDECAELHEALSSGPASHASEQRWPMARLNPLTFKTRLLKWWLFHQATTLIFYHLCVQLMFWG